MRERSKLREQQRGALLGRQLAQIGEEVAQIGALLHLLGQAGGGQIRVERNGSRRERSIDRQRLRAIA